MPHRPRRTAPHAPRRDSDDTIAWLLALALAALAITTIPRAWLADLLAAAAWLTLLASLLLTGLLLTRQARTPEQRAPRDLPSPAGRADHRGDGQRDNEQELDDSLNSTR